MKADELNWDCASKSGFESEVHDAAMDAPEYFCRAGRFEADLRDDLIYMVHRTKHDNIAWGIAYTELSRIRNDMEEDAPYRVREGTRNDIAESMLQHLGITISLVS